MDKKSNLIVIVFGLIVCGLVLFDIGRQNDIYEQLKTLCVTSDDGAADNTVTAKNWDTDVKEFTMKATSGEELKFHTPEGMYSLTDQYLDNLSQYQEGASVKSDTMVVVGDASSPYQAKTVINANVLSDVENMLKQLYGDEFSAEDIKDSEAYTYMKTGKLPDELPLNYEIEEVGKYEVGDITYAAYVVEYDTEYEAESEEDSSESTEQKSEPKIETIHTEQLVCYSNTEDAVEIVIYQSEFDKESALNILKQFIGAE